MKHPYIGIFILTLSFLMCIVLWQVKDYLDDPKAVLMTYIVILNVFIVGLVLKQGSK